MEKIQPVHIRMTEEYQEQLLFLMDYYRYNKKSSCIKHLIEKEYFNLVRKKKNEIKKEL